MKQTKLLFPFALLFGSLALTAPAPGDRIPLVPAGQLKVDNLVVNAAALIDENRVVIVGRTGSVEDTDVAMNEGVPNGAIIDLTNKEVQHFANQHATQIWGVSSYGGRVLTSSGGLHEELLLSWDLKTQESNEVVKFNETLLCNLRCFHRSDKVVMDATERLLVFSSAKPKERLELPCPEGVDFLSRPLAVSPDDARIACTGSEHDQVVWFQLATKKATVVEVSPKDAGAKWLVFGLTFSPSGKLFVCRHGNDYQVPKGQEEKDVPAERRGIVRIDLPTGTVVPLNMGHTVRTSACAIDGSETWLATVGCGYPNKPDGDPVGELRVYNLASGKLAYREKLKGGNPKWVWFTPSSQRLVCVTNDGMVRWWDMPVR